MKQILYTLGAFLLCQLGTVSSHAQSWQWAKQMGGNIAGSTAEDSREEVFGLQVDKKGNSYVLFSTYTDLINPNKVQLDGTDLGRKSGAQDFVLASFDCSGKLRWGKLFGGKGLDRPRGLKIDTLGGVYIVGYIDLTNVGDTVKIDDDATILSPTTVSVKDYRRLVIMKYDSAGNYKWLRMPEPDTIGSNRSTWACDFDVSPTGKISLLTAFRTTGAFASGAYIVPASTTLPAIHMLQYDASGSFIKGFPMAISGTSIANIDYLRMAWDWKNDAYYVGAIKYVGEPALSFSSSPQTGAYLLAKFSNTGSSLWVKQTDNTGSALLPISPVLDQNGNIYIAAGDYDGKNFCGHIAKDSFFSTGRCQSLVKVNSSGVLQWGTNISVTTGSGLSGCAVSNTGTVAFYIGITGNIKIGSFSRSGSGTAMVPCQLVFNASTGGIKSLDTLRGNNLANFNAACADYHGNFYSAYSYDVNFKMGSTTLGKYGGYTDVALVKWGEASCDPIPGTGIAEAANTTTMKVYPNPAQDRIFVENAPAGTRLRLCNLLGAEVYSAVVGSTAIQSIPLNGLAPGMYILQSRMPTGEQHSVKVIKE